MWMELKKIHARWYWYRRWRDSGHVRSQYVGRPRVPAGNAASGRVNVSSGHTVSKALNSRPR